MAPVAATSLNLSVFVSYSHEDKAIVGPLVRLIGITGSGVFRDEDSIQLGDPWRAAIESAIDRCDLVLLFWCRHSADSAEVAIEYRRAIAKGKRVVPALLDATPMTVEIGVFQAIDLKFVGAHQEGSIATAAGGTAVTGSRDGGVKVWEQLFRERMASAIAVELAQMYNATHLNLTIL